MLQLTSPFAWYTPCMITYPASANIKYTMWTIVHPEEDTLWNFKKLSAGEEVLHSCGYQECAIKKLIHSIELIRDIDSMPISYKETLIEMYGIVHFRWIKVIAVRKLEVVI